MNTHKPQDLLTLWAREEPPPEMMVGHILQNLVEMEQRYTAQTITNLALKKELDRLEAELQALRAEVKQLQMGGGEGPSIA